jgi:uncharacterized surface protein with fasciclin (FAS1) repeats
VKGRRRAKDVAGQTALASMGGQSLPIQASNDRVRIGDATIQKTDIEAENGVVHVIDQVLLP